MQSLNYDVNIWRYTLHVICFKIESCIDLIVKMNIRNVTKDADYSRLLFWHPIPWGRRKLLSVMCLIAHVILSSRRMGPKAARSLLISILSVRLKYRSGKCQWFIIYNTILKCVLVHIWHLTTDLFYRACTYSQLYLI